MNLLLLSSCLGSSNDGDLEYSPDAQIYSFSMASKADTLNLLSTTEFSIDQVNSRIFNKKPLPYQFHVDSVVLNIRGANNLSTFSDVTIQLIPDSSYAWVQSDSIEVSRLHKIITTAPDGITKKTYEIQLYIYQQDPYIMSWEKVAEGYLPTTVNQQKTLEFNNRFITYYIANGASSFTSTSNKLLSSPSTNGASIEICLPDTFNESVTLSTGISRTAESSSAEGRRSFSCSNF
jgi:hypothetical protein